MTAATASPLLDVADLRVRYGKGVHSIEAVAGVSFSIARGESVGLVGESGCGKSSLGRALLRLEPVAGGSIRVNGSDPLSFSGSSLFQFRKQMQMVFQDPFGSLNPRMTVGAMLDEVLHVHGESDRSARLQRMDELMGLVGLDSAYLGRFPHEFSGGQRQRIGIARALAVRPELIIADEPVSALDVSVQVQILNLFRDLRKRLNLTYLFIAHDLAVVRYVCDRVLVMYRGQVVESGPSAALFERPAHPYTRLLVDSVPDVEHGLSMRDAGVREGSAAGEDSRTSSTGCPFRARCARAVARCASEAPSLVETSGGRAVSCHVPVNESGS